MTASPNDSAAILAALERGLAGVAHGTPFLAGFLGIDPHFDGQRTTIEFEVVPQFCNRRGHLHGGIIALLFDTTMGNLHRNGNGLGATIELKVQYLRAVGEGRLRCEAQFLKKGRRVSFLEARMTDASGALIAFATGTWNRAEAVTA